MRKRLVPRIAIVYLTKTSKWTLFCSHGNQRPPSEINSSVGPHQRGSSIEKAIHWLVRNKWIDDPHRHSQTRTICKGRLRSTVALTEEWLHMSLSTSFLNGDVAQKVERSFRMREERGSMPGISNFSEKTGIRKTNTTGRCYVRSKENIDKYVQYSMGNIWNGSA